MTSLAAGAVVVLLYMLLVLTPQGQRIDDDLLEVIRADDLTRHELTSALHLINVSTIVVFIAVVLLIAWLRQRSKIGLVATGGFVAAIVLAETLKAILPRPVYQVELDEEVGKAGIDTFPSGHSTIIAAGVIALLWAWGVRSRLAWGIGAVVVLVVAGSTVVAGWHRISDAIGGIALAIAVMAAAARCRSGQAGGG